MLVCKFDFAVLADGSTQYQSPPAYYQGTQSWEREQQGQISGVQKVGLGEVHGDNSGGSSQEGEKWKQTVGCKTYTKREWGKKLSRKSIKNKHLNTNVQYLARMLMG